MTSKQNKSSVVRQIRKHARHLVRELDVIKGVYLDSGYTFTQCHVLFELSNHKSMHLMELSQNLLLDKSNTSRTVKKLVEHGLVKMEKDPGDSRQKLFSLTTKGQKILEHTVGLADRQVEDALVHLTEPQQQQVIEGMRLYADALKKSRLQEGFSIRAIQKQDDAHIARIIREVMTEFGAVGEGYSINDTEVDEMFANYRDRKSCYFVVVKDEQIVGGAGIGPLKGGKSLVCELRKMFFLPLLRGRGLGYTLVMKLMEEARKRNYKQCYLETLDRMWQANALYQKCGFRPLKKAMGNTGHSSCDRWYLKDL